MHGASTIGKKLAANPWEDRAGSTQEHQLVSRLSSAIAARTNQSPPTGPSFQDAAPIGHILEVER